MHDYFYRYGRNEIMRILFRSYKPIVKLYQNPFHYDKRETDGTHNKNTCNPQQSTYYNCRGQKQKTRNHLEKYPDVHHQYLNPVHHNYMQFELNHNVQTHLGT